MSAGSTVRRIRCRVQPLTTAHVGKSPATWLNEQVARGKHQLSVILAKIQVLKLVLNHPSTPLSAKAICVCALGYLLSPIQVIPTFIPVIGQLDDLAVVLAGIALVRKLTPADILKECEDRAASKTYIYRADKSRSYAASLEGSD